MAIVNSMAVTVILRDRDAGVNYILWGGSTHLVVLILAV